MKLKVYILFVLFTACLSVAYAQQSGFARFIENKGQWDKQVRYLVELAAGNLYIHPDGFTVVQHNTGDWARLLERAHGHNSGVSHDRTAPTKDEVPTSQRPLTVRSHAYRVRFANANPSATLVPDKPLPGHANYFIGNDPAQWATQVKHFGGITIKNLYNGIDARYYTQNGKLKYDLMVHPGADPSQIVLRYDGADKLEIKNKELVVRTSVGDMRELAPYSYQYDLKGRREVPSKYVVQGNEVRFELKAYDPKSMLVIDPTLVFASFSGSASDNWGFTATYGPDGSMYGGGIVAPFSNGTGGFPTSPGAFQSVHAGGTWDIGLIKLTPDGSNRVYATYLGGSGVEQPHSLVVDAQGNLIMAGRTESSNFPADVVVGSTTNPDYDIVVVKLSPDGSSKTAIRVAGDDNDGVNIAPTREGPQSLQRNYGDDGRSEVILDNAGNIYVASATQSDDFPRGNSGSNTYKGKQDGVLLKFPSNLSSLLWTHFIGGTEDDAAYVLSISPITGNIYVAGGTKSTAINTTPGVISPGNNGDIDGFITAVRPDGTSAGLTTFLGTTNIDQIYGIQFDRAGFPYVMGQTYGSWPVLNAPFSQAGGKQFIAKLQPDLSRYVYSTVFGTGSGIPNISPVAFLVDRCENVYVSGWGGNKEYPLAGTRGLSVVNNLKTSTDNKDFYFFVLKRDAASQLYGDFFGQNGGYPDHVDGGTSRFDANGVIYMAMCADCMDNESGSFRDRFPTTFGAWSYDKPASANCNLAMVKIALDLAGVAGNVRSSINGTPRDTAGCVPLTVQFSDTIRSAVSYEWNFGDGSPTITTTSPDTAHTYTRVGLYRVMLVAIDSTSCNIRDTSYLNIRVGDLRANLDFTYRKEDPCDAFRFSFTNRSTTRPERPFTDTSFIWDFGDGNRQVGGLGTVFHNYAGPGTYIVRLFLNDTGYCNFPDVLADTLYVATNVIARFDAPVVACAPSDVAFNNTSVGGQTYRWDFGDGGSSTERSPVHRYTAPGRYTVRLQVEDLNTCNRVDDTTIVLQVYGKPDAEFTVAPQPPQVNQPVLFTPQVSSDVTRLKWLFGDGDSLVTVAPSVVPYEYNNTGTYTACLIVYNPAGCTDTVCHPVQMLIDPLVDVPNAFTPNSSDGNNKVFVRGFGIAKMKFTIYSRWGEKVFETDSKRIGWDGRYKGKLMPMDVYAYTLDVEFGDGTRTRKTGDITLIR